LAKFSAIYLKILEGIGIPMTDSLATSYVIISPVKDEERYIEKTMQAVVRQTIRPAKWIIVDDGSRDRSPDIVQHYCSQYPWIQLIRIDRNSARNLGVTEIRAFAVGYELIKEIPHSFVVKMDCDLDLPPDYFECLLKTFQENPNQGIASGIYLESVAGVWTSVEMPAYHAAGATKVVRVECFREIGGFVLDRGWDTIDEIRAQMRGWETCHFSHIKFHHLKKEGSSAGNLSTCAFHGQIYYLTGGGFLFFLLKCLRRSFSGSPFLVGGPLMLYGYLKARISGIPRLVNDAEATFYRGMLNQRVFGKFLGRSKQQKPNGNTLRYS
jgi:biofilm PGA synthesis N-glycosyltransferase PgaC